jgi:hypothetical protein
MAIGRRKPRTCATPADARSRQLRRAAGPERRTPQWVHEADPCFDSLSPHRGHLERPLFSSAELLLLGCSYNETDSTAETSIEDDNPNQSAPGR